MAEDDRGVHRSTISAIPRPSLATIQRATMHHSWKGVLCNKNPFDLAIYPLLLWRIRPATIIEVGTKEGGSALWLWDTCQTFGLDTQILSVDIDQRAQYQHEGITFFQGDGRKLQETLTPQIMRGLERPLLIIEDADHHLLTTLGVMRFADRWLKAGEYILVEDGICDSFGNEARYDGGPNKAVRDYQDRHPGRFELDTAYCDYYGYNVTWCTNGFLKKLVD